METKIVMTRHSDVYSECCDTQTLRKFIDTNISGSYDISFQIADYKRLYPLLAETEFPNKLIMNCWPDKFLALLSDKGQ